MTYWNVPYRFATGILKGAGQINGTASLEFRSALRKGAIPSMRYLSPLVTINTELFSRQRGVSMKNILFNPDYAYTFFY